MVVLAACGSSSSSSKLASPVIARAADVTGQTPGFKFTEYGTVTVSAPQQVVIPLSMTGSYNRPARSGEVSGVIHAAGRTVNIKELFSHFTLYMSAADLPNVATVTGGRPWLKLDISAALPGGGLSSLPTSTDPTQFIDYLRTVSSSITKLGQATIRGVPVTGYRAVIDLDRYPSLVPPAQRSGVRRTIKTLEASLGQHSMPVEVWIDAHNLVRREKLSFTQCISNVHQSINLNIDLYDYGPQPAPRIPGANEVYDATPLAAAALSHQKLSCTS